MRLYHVFPNQTIMGYCLLIIRRGEDKRILACSAFRSARAQLVMRRVDITPEASGALAGWLSGEPIEPGSYIVYGQPARINFYAITGTLIRLEVHCSRVDRHNQHHLAQYERLLLYPIPT